MTTIETPIHNGIRGQWNYLEVVDRASGEVERIRLDDLNSAESVAMAAERNGIKASEAWEILLAGGHVTTSGFVRRLSTTNHPAVAAARSRLRPHQHTAGKPLVGAGVCKPTVRNTNRRETMTTATATATDPHASMMCHAIAIYPAHVVAEDGEECFNLHTFLNELEQAIDAELSKPDAPCGAFRLTAEAIARYTWCCLALQGGDRPDGNTFRGMPILD